MKKHEAKKRWTLFIIVGVFVAAIIIGALTWHGSYKFSRAQKRCGSQEIVAGATAPYSRAKVYYTAGVTKDSPPSAKQYFCSSQEAESVGYKSAVQDFKDGLQNLSS